MEDERRAGAAVVLVCADGGVEMGSGEAEEGTSSVEGDTLVIYVRWAGRWWCFSFSVMR